MPGWVPGKGGGHTALNLEGVKRARRSLGLKEHIFWQTIIGAKELQFSRKCRVEEPKFGLKMGFGSGEIRKIAKLWINNQELLF